MGRSVFRALQLSMAVGAMSLLCSPAFAQSSYYNSLCATCHGQAPANPSTCTGCHYHATHPTGNSGVVVTQFNLAATTDKTSYIVGDTITVTLTGGNKSDPSWIRARLYDTNGTQLNGCDPMSASGCNFPVQLTTRAVAGMTGLKVSWYGNKLNEPVNAVYASASGGETRNSTSQSSANHLEEVILTNSFSVAEAPDNSSGSTDPNTTDTKEEAASAGSFDLFFLAATVIGVGMLRRQRAR